MKNFTLNAQPDLSNPLKLNFNDPLLPPPSLNRPLSPLEKKRIQETVRSLDKQAQAKLNEGLKNEAFALWYRELRLQRALGIIEEIEALGRVGAIAWEDNFTEEVRIITSRLVAIQEKIAPQAVEPKLLNSLGEAYQKLRDVDKAIAIYQQILNRQKTTAKSQQTILETLGELYLAKFAYPEAANIYERLLSREENISKISNINGERELTYLKKLERIYTQTAQTNKALAIKEKLVENYTQLGTMERVASLKIAIAQDYATLQQPEKANRNYQDGFNLAWSLQQFALASEALQGLGELYIADRQPEAAIEIYRELLKVERYANNDYGLMNAYDRLGNIYWQQQSSDRALASYTAGLDIARTLNYRVEYFSKQVEKVNQSIRH